MTFPRPYIMWSSGQTAAKPFFSRSSHFGWYFIGRRGCVLLLCQVYAHFFVVFNCVFTFYSDVDWSTRNKWQNSRRYILCSGGHGAHIRSGYCGWWRKKETLHRRKTKGIGLFISFSVQTPDICFARQQNFTFYVLSSLFSSALLIACHQVSGKFIVTSLQKPMKRKLTAVSQLSRAGFFPLKFAPKNSNLMT